MASQKVRAIAEGIYKDERIAPGREFFFDESVLKKDAKGKAVLPKWVEPVSKPAAAAEPEAVKKEEGGKKSDVI